MKYYNQFINERTFSQVGKDRIAKQRAQNNQNRLAKKPGGAIVPVRPGGAKTNKEAVGGLKSVAKNLAAKGAKAAANKGMEMLKNKMADKQRRPPGVGGMVDRTTKRTGSPNSALTKYKEPVPSFKDSVTKGAKSAMGGDAFAKDDSRQRRKAREELGKKGVEAAKGAVKGVGRAAAKALSHGQGGGERFSGSGSGTGTNLKRGGGRGGD